MSMESSEREGVVTFKSMPNKTYRFRLTLHEKKIGIWLEDKETKCQWKSDMLATNEFETKDASITKATATDYFHCFSDCLESSYDGKADDGIADLVKGSNGAPTLQFQLTLKSFATVWHQTFDFPLKSIPLKETDILASKLRDLQEELSAKHEKKAALILKTNGSTYPNEKLPWIFSEGNEELFSIKDGFITFKMAGTYGVEILLSKVCTCEVMKNDKEWIKGQPMQTRYDSFTYTPIYKVGYFEKGSTICATAVGAGGQLPTGKLEIILIK